MADTTINSPDKLVFNATSGGQQEMVINQDSREVFQIKTDSLQTTTLGPTVANHPGLRVLANGYCQMGDAAGGFDNGLISRLREGPPELAIRDDAMFGGSVWIGLPSSKDGPAVTISSLTTVGSNYVIVTSTAHTVNNGGDLIIYNDTSAEDCGFVLYNVVVNSTTQITVPTTNVAPLNGGTFPPAGTLVLRKNNRYDPRGALNQGRTQAAGELAYGRYFRQTNEKVRFGLDANDDYTIIGNGNANPANRVTVRGFGGLKVDTDANNFNLHFINRNSSYSGTNLYINTTRAKSADFDFARFTSSGETDIVYRFKGNGTATTDGSWTGGGADFAEWFPCEEALEPGTTVCVNEDGSVTAASAGQENIIGVVSEKPAFVGDRPRDENGVFLEGSEDGSIEGFVCIGLLGKLTVKEGCPIAAGWVKIGKNRYLVK